MKTKGIYKYDCTVIWLVITIILLLVYPLPYTSGASYYALKTYSSIPIKPPVVILVNGSDNVSVIYVNNTSAKISINAISNTSTYNYSLNIINQNTSSWEIKLEYFYFNYANNGVNATIILHDNSTSRQQILINGGTINQTDKDYTLASTATAHIGVMNLIENAPGGTATIKAHLRIKTPNVTTYTLYVITFEFT